MHCGACGSPDTEVETNLVFCLACGAKTDMHGNAMPRDPEFHVPSTAGAGAGT